MADEVGEGSVKVQETTRKTYTKAENENLAARISTAFAGSSSFTLEHYLETAFSFPECQYVRLYRVAANGAKACVGSMFCLKRSNGINNAPDRRCPSKQTSRQLLHVSACRRILPAPSA